MAIQLQDLAPTAFGLVEHFDSMQDKLKEVTTGHIGAIVQCCMSTIAALKQVVANGFANLAPMLPHMSSIETDVNKVAADINEFKKYINELEVRVTLLEAQIPRRKIFAYPLNAVTLADPRDEDWGALPIQKRRVFLVGNLGDGLAASELVGITTGLLQKFDIVAVSTEAKFEFGSWVFCYFSWATEMSSAMVLSQRGCCTSGASPRTQQMPRVFLPQ